LLYLIVNSTYLPLAFATAYDEITGEAANLTDIKQDDIDGLLVTGGGCYIACYV
jgi:hypothetical protein